MWFWHDNGPAHFTHALKDHLNPAFMVARSGCGDGITWPPKFPDLVLFDFFSWGQLKSLIYETSV